MAGAIRNFRLHFGDQAVLLLGQTFSSIAISAIEAVATLIFCWLGYRMDGLVGAALGCLAATVLATIYLSASG